MATLLLNAIRVHGEGEVAAIMNAGAERARSFAAVHGEDLHARPPRLFHAASRDDGVPSAIGEDGARSPATAPAFVESARCARAVAVDPGLPAP